MDSGNFKLLPISSIKVEEGAKELSESPEMQPYKQYMQALVLGWDRSAGMEEIANLPLEKRYVWRVASALHWGFADFDSETVAVDRMTLSPEDIGKLKALLRLRPIQFCLFLKALVGEDEMDRLMRMGIKNAKQQG